MSFTVPQPQLQRLGSERKQHNKSLKHKITDYYSERNASINYRVIYYINVCLEMWPFIYSISISLYLISNYPEWRDGILTLSHDASALWWWLSSRGQFRSNMSAAGATMPNKKIFATTDHNSTTIWVPPGSSEMKRRTKALFVLGTVTTQTYRTYQGAQIHHHLRGVAGRLHIAQDPYLASIMSTPSSFARTVRDFVKLKCSEYSDDGYSHRFFAFHPDTAWMGAFLRLQETEGPLPLEFAGVSHNLFVLARWMLCERVVLVQALGEAGRNIRFHVLIPAEEPLVIPHHICFVDALGPLTIEGPVSRGSPMVWLKITQHPTTLLRDVGAILPPCPVLAEGKASIAVCLLWIGVSPILLALCKVICSVHIPFYAALAVLLLFHGLALNATLWLKREVKEYYMQDDDPTTLG
ncbi:hypothetical protein NQ176_g2671 [Zarea fungicola]|uniref:Uncharacterized protein n=1 Tax=Zarea fungicola TaxID=93591 RepID=A0ACC1NPQ2_9HYPO|nr:hypothetical protein NQ176_g2671 [Lecanicillium fungicola]